METKPVPPAGVTRLILLDEIEKAHRTCSTCCCRLLEKDGDRNGQGETPG